MQGIVIEFDEHVGLGIIESNGSSIPFHCVHIADGSRTIGVGLKVDFDLYKHPLGMDEACNIKVG